ncbi:ATP-binding cassette domain-containing protein, partial [Frankia sp. Cpl3]|nr:ATP-binding cassette domain-containing protein [Frankia sp. Cpl3]
MDDNARQASGPTPARAAASGDVVAVRDLTKRYGRVEALRNVSFTVPAGAVTGFLGANGSGKTTTLRILLGLVTPTSGQALLRDGLRRELRSYRKLSDPARTVGAVLEPTAHPARSGRDHLRCLAVALGLPRRARSAAVEGALESVDLVSAAPPPVGGNKL